MAARPRARASARVLTVLAGLSLALVAAQIANAGSGDPASIAVNSTGGMSVSASGTWTWPEMLTNSKLSYAGYAIDWGDVTSGNAVPKPGGGAYHVGDGTAATNFVLNPTSPAQGASGMWGPVSHTYAAPGSYTVCVIVYDLGETTPFKATGYHGLRAGGTDRNTDNSVEQNGDVKTNCATIDVSTPTPTPSESTGGETATPAPSATPTPTPVATATPAATATPTPAASESVAGVTSGPSMTPPPTTSGDMETQLFGPSLVLPVILLLGIACALLALVVVPARRRS